MLEIYEASCKNVRELESNQKQLKRMFNSAVLNNRKQEVKSLTKVYALLYSAFAEASFLKMIHTPYGFSEDNINQIQAQRNLSDKWNKCIELTFNTISSQENLGEIQNKKKYLRGILDLYIIYPSQIRNKIAHGQWAIALNSENTKVNSEMSVNLEELDFVKVDILFSIYKKFSSSIEDLIESRPTHYRDYYTIITELGEYIETTKRWDISTRCSRIKNTKGSKNIRSS